MNEEKKNKIIGLGDHSFRKSYFPELQRKVTELNLFKTVFEKSQDQIIIFNPENGAIEFANELARSFFNLNKSSDNLIQDISKKYWQIIQDVIHSKEESISFQFRFTLDNGSYYMSNKVSIVEENNVSYGLLSMRNITNTIDMQNKLIETSEKAKKDAKKKEGLLNAIPDLMFTFDKDGVVVDFNAPDEEELLRKPEDFLNKNVREVLPPNIALLTTQNIEKVLATGEMQTYTYKIKINNEINTFESRLVLLYDDYTLAIVSNITEKVKMINDLKKAKEKAEESDELKSTFLANMSHEIRTPLNGIVGFSNMMAEKELDKDTKKQFSKIITKSSQDLLRIINDILDISRIEAGQILIKPTAFNLNEVFESLQQIFREKLIDINSNVQLIMSIPNAKGIIIKSDETRIKQVLLNLLDNATKYTTNGSITFGYKINNDHIYFSVTDTGIGIKEKDQAIIFERFRQAERPLFETASGTGLGLSISKGIVNMLNGEMGLSSTPGEGSTFWFKIPLNKYVNN